MGAVVSQLTEGREIESVISLATLPADRLPGVARPRVILLSTWHPVPVDNGRKQRTLGLIDALRDDYDVILVSLLPEPERGERQLASVPGVWHQAVLQLPVFDPEASSVLAGGLRRWPRSIVATWNPRTASAIVELARSTGAAVAVGTDLRTLEYLRHLRRHVGGIRTILDEPDVSPFVEIEPVRLAARHLRARLRRRKYLHYLSDATADLDVVLVAAQNEALAYQRLSGGHLPSIVANGVHRFPAPWSTSGSKGMLYTGSLTYGPNLEAVVWYAQTILPLLRTQLQPAVLHITGALPEEIPDVLKHPAFRLTGRLDDLDAIYRASGVFVAPIHSGTGTRVKILEAMAIGMPVVTTTKGHEGIPLVSGEHALVADSPESFTLAILRILRDPVFAQTLGARGREFVQQHGNWEVSAEGFRQIVAGVLQKEC